MGGLDARYMISRMDMAGSVQTLTTLGTPHRGTAFADWAISKVEWLVKPTLAFLQWPHDAFYDLTTLRCKDFNEQTPDAPGVRYFSVAAEHDGSLANPEWLLTHSIVRAAEGANDGVVSLASACHGECFDVWPGNHFTLVNWQSTRVDHEDVLARWRTLVERLVTKQIAATS
jgi:triacylglycerol lipase